MPLSARMEVAEEIIWKRKAWDKSYMKMMENQYDGMTITPSLQRRIIFGFLENPTEVITKQIYIFYYKLLCNMPIFFPQ